MYQPFASAARPAAALATGAVPSYLKPNAVVPLGFPARSLQDPLTEAAVLSGPPYVSWVHAPGASPDVASVPWNARPIGWLNQPLASAARAGLAPVTWGAVASYPSTNERAALLPARSRQEPLTEAPALSGPE